MCENFFPCTQLALFLLNIVLLIIETSVNHLTISHSYTNEKLKDRIINNVPTQVEGFQLSRHVHIKHMKIYTYDMNFIILFLI